VLISVTYDMAIVYMNTAIAANKDSTRIWTLKGKLALYPFGNTLLEGVCIRLT